MANQASIRTLSMTCWPTVYYAKRIPGRKSTCAFRDESCNGPRNDAYDIEFVGERRCINRSSNYTLLDATLFSCKSTKVNKVNNSSTGRSKIGGR